MLETVRKPNTFYAINYTTIINELDKSAYNYYWTSYSRGTDGYALAGGVNFYNSHLNGYIQKQPKSIYDPCPYGFRLSTNGTHSHFYNSGWIEFSYIGGFKHKLYWFPNAGGRTRVTGIYYVGGSFSYSTGSCYNNAQIYSPSFNPNGGVNSSSTMAYAYGLPIRCIEDC